ncbi:hypothetical protein RhiirC2_772829 [Rhizophagus irregularis]|uniref:F-box domain-containing protein n=1 Tax=Rhizophagus irregularis TaxID=588596 RepID=A0A2N1NQH2_9GLOM|nr:hypothetical protein RhiirC2_772829 [Rhizophagus irregularis]
MSKLNHDVLYEIFQNLQDLINMTCTNDPDNLNKMINYKKFLRSQFSCLLVNKNWCEAMIPFLWSNPFKYAYKTHIKSSLFKIIISHLPDNSIKLLKDENIIETNFQKLKLSFNYVRFCKYLNDIHYICTKGLLEEEVYKFFISECSSIKSLNSKMLLYYPILKYPGANISLSNLYELYCITYDQDFYYELAQICKSIEKLHVVIDYEESPGVVKLIEVQTQIKYVFLDGYYECKKIIQALEKHVNSIIHLEMAQYTSSIHFLIPKLINLRFLKVVDYYYYCTLKKYVIYLNHHNLQVLDLHRISLDIAINIIKSTNGNLWKIRIGYAHQYYVKAKEYDQMIHKYCPNIKYVTVFLNKGGTLEELEKIFIKCQHLETIDIYKKINYKYIDKFLNLLLESAPLTLCKIHICNISDCFGSNESLKLFIINWGHHKGKKTLHLYSSDTGINRDIVHKYDIKDFWNYYISW